MDRRKNNGGHSTKGFAGRKTKAEEEKVKRLSTSSIIRIYGSEEAFFDKLAEMAMSEFPALKLLMEYAYGKPTERKEEVQTFNAPILENGKELPSDD
jgi:hypothetical protein